MNCRTHILTIAMVLSLVGVAWACPNCRDTIANSSVGESESLPAGFNYSIYWMLLGLFGVMGVVVRTIYQGLQGSR